MNRAPALAALAAALLGGCDGGEPETKGDEPALVASKSDTELAEWLTPTDPIDTGRWLASRETGRLIPNDDPASAQMRRSLGRAQGYFVEDTRMIANRTDQLGRMLAEQGSNERYEALIEGLVSVARQAQRKLLYGEICQHYYNTRRQGAGHGATLERLSERYGSQPSGEARP